MQEAEKEYFLNQEWSEYSQEEHKVWETLYKQIMPFLEPRVCSGFMEGAYALFHNSHQIPDFNHLNRKLKKRSNWEIVAVTGLVPDELFFKLLSERKFPASTFIRTAEQLNYIQEPDIFHDIFGHIPMIWDKVMADFLQEYGKIGLKLIGTEHLKKLARLYWYTVEFGLINTSRGIKIYGAGIVSSKGETVYSVDSKTPNRVKFDLQRIMMSDYYIDRYQKVYFVIDSYEQLYESLKLEFLEKIKTSPDSEVIPAGQTISTDISF